MDTKLKIGILIKLPLKTKDEVTSFVEKLHKEGFFLDKDDTKYFTRQIEDAWYLEYVTDDSRADTENNTTTAIFDPVKILNECQQIENIIQGDVYSKAYVFVGEYEPYDTVIEESDE
jgi:hypothetical protein